MGFITDVVAEIDKDENAKSARIEKWMRGSLITALITATLTFFILLVSLFKKK